MKTKYHHIKFLFAIALIFLPMTARSQNYIKETEVKSGEYSIVRMVDDEDRIAYAPYERRGRIVFFKETSASVYVMYMPYNYYVNDMEVYDGKAYFCGYKIDTSLDTVGIFGYFNAIYPYPTGLYCCEVTGMKELRKMEVFSIGRNPRAAMIGESAVGVSYVVDARTTATNTWSFTISDNGNLDGNVYDDIAVTDNYVVATSRIPGTLHNYGYLHYYNRPTTNSPFYSNYAYCKKLEYDAYSPILIEACCSDTFATVTRGQFGLKTYFSTYDADAHIATKTINDTSRVLIDIKYNPVSSNIDVLAHYTYGGTVRSEITHFPKTAGGTLLSHKYQRYILASLDYLTGSSGNMVACGIDGPYSALYLFRYKYNSYLCTGWGGYFYQTINNTLTNKKFTKYSTTVTNTADFISCDIEYTIVRTICN